MALNPFFLHGSESEQRLIQELINEQLSMYGMEVAYMPQRMIRRETVIEEVSSARFTEKYMIEAYLSNYEGYSGSGDILSKFGMQLKDEVTLIISKERFEDFISPFLENIPDDENTTSLRPREGDLIYFPLGQRLFEIKFVEHEQPFYQLGKTYVYELKCELFEYSDSAIVATSDNAIDSSLQDYGYIKTLTLFASGARALASAAISSLAGYVRKITLTNDGYGYTTVPTVTIDSPPSSVGAAATVTVDNVGKVTGTTITNGGYYPGYLTTPNVTFSNPTGGGNETTIVKFGSRSYDGGEQYLAGTTISTLGVTDREPGAIEFWFYLTRFPDDGQQWTIAKWGTNDEGNSKYELTVQKNNGRNDIFYYRPNDDTIATRDAITVAADISDNELNRWNWIRLAQDDSGSNRISTHFMGSSGTFASVYNSSEFITTFMNDDGFVLNPDGSFPARTIFLDELRYSSDGSNTQPTLPTSTSKNQPNTILFQDAERDPATGTVVFNDDNVVTGITLTSSGQNYTEAPTVTIDPPAAVVQATAVAITSCIGGFCSVKEIYITNPGAGYTTVPNVTIAGATGVGATASVVINTTYAGIGSIGITSEGSGYNFDPSVTFSLPTAVGVGTAVATGKVNVSAAGTVTSVYFTDAGIGYTVSPTLEISLPQTVTGSGNYSFNEQVVGSSSRTTAYVRSWDSDSKVLKVGNISGEFIDGETIVGVANSATYTIGLLGENPIYEDKYEQNDEIQTESSSIIDFTETNLFGNY